MTMVLFFFSDHASRAFRQSLNGPFITRRRHISEVVLQFHEEPAAAGLHCLTEHVLLRNGLLVDFFGPLDEPVVVHAPAA